MIVTQWPENAWTALAQTAGQLHVLYEGIIKGDIQSVGSFLREHPTIVEELDETKNPVLHVVFDVLPEEVDTANMLSMLGFLLEKGALIDAQNKEGETALHVAIEAGPKVVAFLLEKGADYSVQDSTGQIPLHTAAILGCAESFALLLKQDSNLLVEDNEKMTPLKLAQKQLQESGPCTPSEKCAAWQEIIQIIETKLALLVSKPKPH